MTLGLLVALENADKHLSDIQRIFNTGPYGDPPLKIKILKIGLRSDPSWPKLGLEPTFHDPGTFGGFGKQITDRQDSYKYRFNNIQLNYAFSIQDTTITGKILKN